MPVTLVSLPDFDLASVAAALRNEGLSVECGNVQLGDAPARRVAGSQSVILVAPAQGVVARAELTRILQTSMTGTQQLIVCTPQPISRADRTKAHEHGGPTLITPRSWLSGAVAERILGELIRLGQVEPRTFEEEAAEGEAE